MRDVQKLRELLERVEAANGPDKDIDTQIMGLTYTRGQRSIGAHEDSGPNGSWVPVESDVWIDPVTDKWVSTHPRDFTASLDASIALVERMLPGWWWKVGTCSVSDDACIAPDFNSPIHGDRLQAQFPSVVPGSELDAGFDVDRRPAGNPALALLESLLRALICQAESSTLRDGLTRAEAHKMEGGSGLSSCPLQAEGEGAHREGVPQDVRKLVIAARNVAFDDAPSPEALKALDDASEAFAARVPWEDAS